MFALILGLSAFAADPPKASGAKAPKTDTVAESDGPKASGKKAPGEAPVAESDGPKASGEKAMAEAVEEAPAPVMAGSADAAPVMNPADAQFEAPIKTLWGPEGVVTLPNGDKVEGNPSIVQKGIGNIRKITLKMEDGSKQKFKPADVAGFKMKPNKMAKMGSTKTSITGMASGSNANVWKKEWSVFEPAPLPNGKVFLMQLLNGEFDSTMKVFADPAGRETTGVGGISGGLVKSYLVLKDGAETSMLVKKGTYKKLWPEIFGDCSGMSMPEEPDFKMMAVDVATHATTCGK